MTQAQNKTSETDVSVEQFIAGIEPEQRRADALVLLEIFGRVTGVAPVMWGSTIIGYGRYHYKYESGREGDFMRTGFSPRKANISIYLIGAYEDAAGVGLQDKLLAALGKHKMGKSCLYVNRLDQIDMNVLEQLVVNNWALMARKYPN